MLWEGYSFHSSSAPCLYLTGLACGGAQVLMLVPTRELALQTSAIVKEIGKHTGVQCMVSCTRIILDVWACTACVFVGTGRFDGA